MPHLSQYADVGRQICSNKPQGHNHRSKKNEWIQIIFGSFRRWGGLEQVGDTAWETFLHLAPKVGSVAFLQEQIFRNENLTIWYFGIILSFLMISLRVECGPQHESLLQKNSFQSSQQLGFTWGTENSPSQSSATIHASNCYCMINATQSTLRDPSDSDH